MSGQSMALASITATYMDSDAEDDENEVDKIENEEDIVISKDSISPPPAPEIKITHISRLVSYNDDTFVSDADITVGDVPDVEIHEVPIIKTEPKLAEVHMFPEPTGRCSNELQEKINKLHTKMEKGGLDMNDVIQRRKEFRNPSIYEKLVQFCGIEELGSNYSPEVYDPFCWGKESYYEELALVQKEEVEKQLKERKDKTKIQFVSGTVKRTGTGDDDKQQRKTKWDQIGIGAIPAVQSNIRNPTGFLQKPSLTTVVSGSKGPVILAYGDLTKKPKVSH